MEQQTVSLSIKISVAWWLRGYLYLLVIFCALMHAEPDMKKVRYWLDRGIKVKVVTGA